MPVWFVFGVQSSATDTVSRAGCACDGTATEAVRATAHRMNAMERLTSNSLRWHYPDQVHGSRAKLGLSHVGTPVASRLALSSSNGNLGCDQSSPQRPCLRRPAVGRCRSRPHP